MAIESVRIKLPEPLSHNQIKNVPYVLVGDETFRLEPNFMRPYGGKLFDIEKRAYNYRLNRARRYLEYTFGIMLNKWRIFHRPINVSMSLATKIVQARCVRHNFVRERKAYNFEDTLSMTRLNDATLSQI